jgi:hypothetical protein
MGFLDKLLRRKPPLASPEKARAQILALVLLRCVLTRFEIQQDDFDRFMKAVEVDLRPLCREWIVIFVAWMLIFSARGIYGKQFSEDMLAAMSEHAAALPEEKPTEERLQFWFQHLDDVAYAEAVVIKGAEVPPYVFMALRFLVLDPRSSYYRKEEFSGSVEWDVARAFAAANDAMLPYVEKVMSNVQDVVSKIEHLKDNCNA